MCKSKLSIFCALMLLVFLCFSCSKTGAEKLDILITNGQIIDGTGNPWFQGDIGIKEGTIVAIGNLTELDAEKTIDAKGLIVAPGYIDMHTHCDSGLGRPSNNANLNYLTQGVTTVVTGNCGGSVSLNVAETKQKWEDQGIGTNVVFLVGHGTIRRAVMDVEPRESTPAEIEEMKEVLRQSMREGAWGISTGLEYIPGRYSNTEEVIELTKVVGEFGGIYTSHMRDECSPIDGIKETIRIGEESGVPVNVAHFKVCGKNFWGLMMKDAVKVIEDARARGVHITADQYPYIQSAPIGPIVSILNIPDDMEPLAGLRKKGRDRSLEESEREKIRTEYVDELKKALTDQSKREQIKKLTLEGLPHDPSAIAMWGWHNVTLLVANKNTDLVGKNIADLAREQKRDAIDIVMELVIDEPDILYSGGSMSEKDLQHALKQEWTMVSSDGGAIPIIKETDEPRMGHPRNFGSFTKVLRKYVRDENLLTLEEAIRKMTSLPASFLQMKDRGLLIEGHKADIVIFDSKTVTDNATYADARKYSSGIEYVIVNGKISIENGEYNNTLHGKLLLLTENK